MGPRLRGDDAAVKNSELFCNSGDFSAHSCEGIHPDAMRAFVYILASKPRGTLYIGVTNDLVRRVHEHKTGIIEGFTKKYAIHKLVYYEIYEDVANAIAREKCVKKWDRAWKIGLIEEKNLYWEDLYELICR